MEQETSAVRGTPGLEGLPMKGHFKALTAAFATWTIALPMSADAQDTTANPPLRLRDVGSFFIGGKIVGTDAANSTIPESPAFSREGTIAVDQMYVRYLRPVQSWKHVPIVLIHGGTVSGTNYETTPDGRMGWDQYLARKGRSTYVVDQVGRGRSNFDVTPFNRVRLEMAPPETQPALRVLTREQAWTVFRFGPRIGTPFPGQQFPIEAADELAKQAAPTQDANSLPHLSALAQKLRGAVLVGHSQSGQFPQRTVLMHGRAGIRGVVNMDIGCGNVALTDDDIRKLAEVPYLSLWGDFVEEATSAVPDWPAGFADCQAVVARLQAAGGDATLIHLPDLGIHGNSHMLMMDKNNLEVADVLLDWIDSHVETRTRE